jgi:hypothetical protein
VCNTVIHHQQSEQRSAVFTAAAEHLIVASLVERSSMGGSFSGNTTGAPFSNGNPAATCGLGPGSGSCINGCRSDFYRITTHGSGTIQALACRDAAATAAFYPRIYVWEGNSTAARASVCPESNERIENAPLTRALRALPLSLFL